MMLCEVVFWPFSFRRCRSQICFLFDDMFQEFMIAVPKVLDLSHDNRLSLTNCMCNLGSVRRCQNFLVCTEYSEYAVITECSYVSEIFNLVD